MKRELEKSKHLLLEKHYSLTIHTITQEEGFNSRASFYRAFKKNTNITTLVFLKNYRR